MFVFQIGMPLNVYDTIIVSYKLKHLLLKYLADQITYNTLLPMLECLSFIRETVIYTTQS